MSSPAVDLTPFADAMRAAGDAIVRAGREMARALDAQLFQVMELVIALSGGVIVSDPPAPAQADLAAARLDPTAAGLLARLEDATRPDWVLAGVFADRLAELGLHRLERAVRWLIPERGRRKGRWPQWASRVDWRPPGSIPGPERLWRHHGGNAWRNWWDVTAAMTAAFAASYGGRLHAPSVSRHASWGDAVADLEAWLPPPG